MPLPAMRTKSAGLLGVLTKLPPLEREGSGEGAALRGGEGAMGAGREPGDFLRGGGGLRNITSAPAMGSFYPPSVAAPSQPAGPVRMDTAKAVEPTDDRALLSGGQYCCLSPVDLAADGAAGLPGSRGSAERSLDWKATMAKFGSDRSPREVVGESGAGKRAMRSRSGSLAPISVPPAATSLKLADAEGPEVLTSLMIPSLSGGGLGSSAVFGFGGFSSSSGGADGKSGFPACSTPGGTNSISNAPYARSPPGGHLLASSCSGSGNGIVHHHGATEAGAGPRGGGDGCGDGKVSVV